MQVMVGCMIETTCAFTAATHFAFMTDCADLDGNLLVQNDFFDGLMIRGGYLLLTDKPGIGVERLKA